MNKARKCTLAKVADLIPPDGHVIHEDVVAELAASIVAHGLREPVVVVNRHILHGVHRWEAARRAGLETIEVVEDEQVATAEAHEAQVIVENLHRRHLPLAEIDRLRKRLVELRMPQIAQERQTIPNSPSKGKLEKPIGYGSPPQHQPSVRGDAVRAVAKEIGATPKAVARSIERTNSVAQGRINNAIKDGRIDTGDEFNNPIPKALRERWDTMRDLHDQIDKLTRKAQGLCTELGKVGGDVSSYCQHWHEQLHEVSFSARHYEPYAVCPKCGGKGCDLCHKIGFVAEAWLPRKQYAKLIGEAA